MDFKKCANISLKYNKRTYHRCTFLNVLTCLKPETEDRTLIK